MFPYHPWPTKFLFQQGVSSIIPLRWESPCSSVASLDDLKLKQESLHKKGFHRPLTPRLVEWMMGSLNTS